MKKLLTIMLVALLPAMSNSQDLTNPGTYMTAISSAQLEMNAKYMAYLSASAHSTRKRKDFRLIRAILFDSGFFIVGFPIISGAIDVL